MTEAKPTPKERSTFVPIIFGVLVVGLFMFATLVPTIECKLYEYKNAEYENYLKTHNIEIKGSALLPGCHECEGRGRIPIWNLWHWKVESP